MDGQIREINEPFEVEGKETMYPGGFGDLSEDCNCRCCLLQRAKWALSEEEYYTKYNGDKNELVRVESKTYNEFKNKVTEGIREKKEEIQVHLVGKIDKEIYKCITDDIVTDEVIITDERIVHIKERHPGDYETVLEYMAEAIRKPDYIFKDGRKNTGLVIKSLDEENVQAVLRIHTSEDEEGYKNSIISCWKISKRRLQNYLRNKEILYKNE